MQRAASHAQLLTELLLVGRAAVRGGALEGVVCNLKPFDLSIGVPNTI